MGTNTLNSYTNTGINLTNAGADLTPFTITANGTIITTGIAVESQVYQATLVNQGVAASTAQTGIYLLDGGSVTNGSVNATISGYNGVQFQTGFYNGAQTQPATGTLINDGTVTGSNGDGADLYHGGMVTNSGTGSAITGTRFGVAVQHGAGIVVNDGVMTGIAAGIALNAGGYAGNLGAGASIAGHIGVYIGGTAGTVFNEGTITGGNGFGYYGVFLYKGGTLTNSGTAALVSGYKGVFARQGTGVVLNQGTIAGAQFGTELFQGGTVTNNGTAALITGGNTAIQISGNTGTVFNDGTIDGTNTGIALEAGGYISNSSTGLINGGVGAIYTNGTTATVLNAGTITSTTNGVILRAGGTISNLGTGALISSGAVGAEVQHGGLIYNAGTIISNTQYAAGLYGSGTIVNDGTAALISGYTNGINAFSGAATVVNDGTILSTEQGETGVVLQAGGMLTNNGPAALITGYNGIDIEGAAGTILNSGTIAGAAGSDGYGLRLYEGGYVLNSLASAVIYGGRSGVATRTAPATVVNAGTITGAGENGVALGGGGAVTNSGTGALISGHYAGVYINGSTGLVDNDGTIIGTTGAGGGTGVALYDGGTIINSGTIAGDYRAVFMAGSGDNLLVAETGAVFTGNVVIAGTGNTLELAGTGSLGGLGGSINGFSTFAFDPGAAWTLSGGLTALAGGETITGFNLGDELDLSGFSATSVSYVAGTGLVLSNVTTSYTLALAARQPNAQFAYTSTPGGTDITEIGIHTLVTTYANQLTITNNGAYLNAFTIAPAGEVTSTQGTVVSSALAGASLTNYGTIFFQPGASTGQNPAVEFTNGGYAANLGTAALISGYYGVKIDNAAGTVYNEGTITGTLVTSGGSLADGVLLTAGGTVTNSGTAATIAGYQYGVRVETAVGTVLNAGTISAVVRADVQLGYGGYVGNLGTAALLTGGRFGVYLGSGAGTVVNQGTIATQYGVQLSIGGTVDNSGTAALIASQDDGVTMGIISPAYAGIVTNQGTIAVTSSSGFGVAIINIGGAAGTVLNSGLIAGGSVSGVGIYLSGGGYVSNSTAQGTISGGQTGIEVTSTYGTVLNAGGSITGGSGDGITLGAGGYVYNGASALIAGGGLGVDIGGAYGAVVNDGGSITGGEAGIRVTGGTYAYAGNLGGTVIGGTGIYLAGFANHVYNSGVIIGTNVTTFAHGTAAAGYGVALGGVNDPIIGTLFNSYGLPFTFNDTSYGGAALLTNSATGTISGTDAGVGLRASGDAGVVNAGLITGGHDGVLVSSILQPVSQYYGLVENLPGGIISGTSYGVRMDNVRAIVVNAGTISGGTDAVYFAGTGANLLVVEAGAVFNGDVIASSSATNVLELDSLSGSGSLSGIGSQFTGFGTIAFAYGANWVLGGDSAGLAAGQQIDGFAPGDTLDLTNIVADSDSFANGTLTLYDGGVAVAALDILAQNVTSGSFALTTDGGAGTDITRLPPNPNTLQASTIYGITLTPGGTYQTPFTVTNSGNVSTNYGAGIYSAYNASVTVYGTVSGAYGGVMLAAGGTLIAAAPISTGSYSAYAVNFGTGAAVLVVENGAGFTGAVTADPGLSNVLDDDAGLLAGLGTQITGFETINLGGGTQTLSGTSPGLASGETLNGFAAQDVLDITDLTITSERFASGTLSLFDGAAQVGSLIVSGADLSSTDFSLSSDGGTGTDIFALARTIISSTLNTGVTLSPAGAYNNNLTVTNTGAVFANAPGNAGIYETGAYAMTIAHGASIIATGNFSDGIDLNGASLDNAGLVAGERQGIRLAAAGGTVFNATGATISGGQYGVAVYYGARIDNQGLIEGGPAGGIYALGFAGALTTVENGGTIASSLGASGSALKFAQAADLIIDAGAVFIGTVAADAGGVLELSSSASTGTISGIGTSFTGFSTLKIDTGASWVISGDSAGLDAGQTIIGFGTLDITDVQADSENFSNGVLTLYEGGVYAGTLNIANPEHLSSADFSLGSDGAAGTDVVLIPKSPYIISTSLSSGITLNPGGSYSSPLTITNTGAVNTSDYYGIFSAGAATILNYGYVSATNGRYVLALNGGASVTNATGGVIEGRLHLDGSGAETLINAGSINGFMLIGGNGAYISNASHAVLDGGSQIGILSTATVVNAGSISESNNGLVLDSGGTVTNLATGSIYGGGNGIGLGSAGLVTNAGSIGGGTGIYEFANQKLTVQNAGTIAGTGGTAVNFGSANADLIVAPGAVFIGNAVANAGYTNTLELTSATSAGTLTCIGSQFTNFNNLLLDTGASWTLSGSTAGFNGDTITGFSAHDKIDVTDLSATPEIVTLDAGGVLDIGGLAFTFGSAEAGALFTISSDGGSGTDITDNVLCFLEGTNIATPSGEVPVETLRIGDAVLTADGGIVPVRWIGIHTAARRFADPLRVQPIRIKQSALGNNLPRRDLLVSPDHAMYLGGILIQAAALVNGTSILRETHLPERFVYYHVETAHHALILAEGAATETFVDNADRMGFDNWAEHEALYGDEPNIPEMAYARAKSARQIPAALRRLLDARAAALADYAESA